MLPQEVVLRSFNILQVPNGSTKIPIELLLENNFIFPTYWYHLFILVYLFIYHNILISLSHQYFVIEVCILLLLFLSSFRTLMLLVCFGILASFT